MPCWYFEKKELRNTPSFQDGIDAGTEARYRREGARFIIDAGTKMGLRYDTCGTGVVYFHRFYMFHSFKEFHRYITAACCLFLAGKVEETPKKGKDIIKICQSMLSPQVFSVFGDDPREEVMTMERILLQTIKFDLQVEHPYGYLLKFAKFIKGDKEKIQKLVQMAWTFINDSLCTTQCLQWEPEVISVSLMYLGTRLTKFDIQDWHGKVPGTKTKWWEFLVEDITVELMEDICHKVLDLYSNNPQGAGTDSPPVTPSKKSGTARDTPPPPPPQIGKRSLPTTPAEAPHDAKVPKPQPERQKSKDSSSRRNSSKKSGSAPDAPSSTAVPRSAPVSSYSSAPPVQSKPDYTQYGAYMASSSSQYPSSFLSQEGSKSIETLVSGSGLASTSSYLQTQAPTPAASAPAAVPQYPPPAQYPPAPYQPTTYAPPTAYQQPPPVQPQYPAPGTYPPAPVVPGAPLPQQAFHTNQPPPQVGQYPPGFPPPQQFNAPPFQGQTNFPPPPPPRPGFPPQPGVSAPPPFQTMPPNTGALNTMGQPQGPAVPMQNNMVPPQPSSGLPVVRITGRR